MDHTQDLTDPEWARDQRLRSSGNDDGQVVCAPVLAIRRRRLEVGGTLVMGIVNASPESFSDAGRYGSFEQQRRLADALMAAGADVLDVGGQSAITNRAEIATDEEVGRVVPLILALRQAYPEVLISIDTYKLSVAKAAVVAGADIVNDVSGLRDPRLAELCADSGCALVLMHTRARPLERLADGIPTDDPVADVRDFLDERMRVARGCGMPQESIILDPGPDFGKTPAQTVQVLRHLDDLRAFGRPLLLALSRKDFLGAITQRRPLGREAATTAALALVAARGGNIARVHDVGAAVDALAVVDVLTGRRHVSADYRLPDELRHEPVSASQTEQGAQ